MVLVNRLFLIVIAGTVLLLEGCVAMPHKDPVSYESTLPRSARPVAVNNGAIYQAATSMTLFEDLKARRIGDILVVVLTEKTNASKSANTTTKKENTLDSGADPKLFGRTLGTDTNHNVLGFSVESANEFTGEADSDQSNSLTGSVAVTVAEVLPNGNLVVRGQKRMTLNQGEEYIQITGIVRPADIRADNSVLSTLVADARITYSGTGVVADSNSMGWLSRFFNSSLWPL